jgi:hypothetical protein
MRIDLYTSNFSARYGRRLGGIIEVSLRDPKADGWHGMLDVNIIDASAFVEGPVSRNLSGMAAFRRSYIDAFFGALADSTDLSVTAAPVYSDYQLMATWRPREADRLRVMVLGSADDMRLVLKKAVDTDAAVHGNLKQETAFHRLHAQWLHRYGDRVEQELSLSAGPMVNSHRRRHQHRSRRARGLGPRRVARTPRQPVAPARRHGHRAGLWRSDLPCPRLPAFEGDPGMGAPLTGREQTSLVYNAWIKRPGAYAELPVQAIPDPIARACLSSSPARRGT